ncbi:MAG: DUF1501 domain-containing protein [Bryobacteraceae bacterium]|nr:DUF1501 domain-containing protein [Bryobacteraceae bacterium]
MKRRTFLTTAAGIAAFQTAIRRGDAEVVAPGARVRNTARACIFINLNGAPSHLDTFDPKDGPWNPTDIDLQTTSGGFVLSKTIFPSLSKMASQLCVLKSVTSWEAAHERGQFYLQTAHPSNPAFASETPGMGAIISLEKGAQGPLPPFLSLNGGLVQGSKFLGGLYEPLTPGLSRTGLSTLEHNFYGTASAPRFEDKFALLNRLDEVNKSRFLDEGVSAHASYYDSAKRMMYNTSIADVFKWTVDDEGRYGPTSIGRSCITARNAVRAKNGCSFVNITYGGWDMHQQMFDRNYQPNIYTLAGDLDRAVGALVEDLQGAGLLGSTLIVIMGEFGRTPGPLNSRGGRDHHKDAMSAVMLGGGVRGGQAIGETAPDGSKVITPGWSGNRAILMEDIACTIYSALGIDYTKSLTDTPSGRKFEYVQYATEGRYVPVEEVFA